MAVQPQNGIRQQAELLARDNRENDPDIVDVLWFPHHDEVRLVETTEQIPQTLDGEVHPFYFRASPQDDLPRPTAIALIRPDERGKLQLPEDWGDWDDAVEL